MPPSELIIYQVKKSNFRWGAQFSPMLRPVRASWYSSIFMPEYCYILTQTQVWSVILKIIYSYIARAIIKFKHAFMNIIFSSFPLTPINHIMSFVTYYKCLCYYGHFLVNILCVAKLLKTCFIRRNKYCYSLYITNVILVKYKFKECLQALKVEINTELPLFSHVLCL